MRRRRYDFDPSTRRILWTSSLPETRARQLLSLAASQGLNFIATHPEGDIFALSDVKRWNLTRISLMDSPEAQAEALAVRFSPAPDLNVVEAYLHYNGCWAVDFTAAGVHKGYAARKLLELLGSRTNRFIAAGDSFNDSPLLHAASLRIAMASAPPEVTAIADYLAPPVEQDGLALAIEELVLPLLKTSLSSTVLTSLAVAIEELVLPLLKSG